jgi:hypothetical protein
VAKHRHRYGQTTMDFSQAQNGPPTAQLTSMPADTNKKRPARRREPRETRSDFRDLEQVDESTRTQPTFVVALSLHGQDDPLGGVVMEQRYLSASFVVITGQVQILSRGTIGSSVGAFSVASHLLHVTTSSPIFVLVVCWQDAPRPRARGHATLSINNLMGAA